MSKIVLATTTLYKDWYPGTLKNIADTDKVRGDLALSTIRAAVDAGYSVVVADRLSPQEFTTELVNTGAIIEHELESKRSPGRRRVFARAANIPGTSAIIWTEAEKTDLIKSIPVITSPIIEGEADLVIPKRDPTFFKAFYPRYMFESEIIGNRLANRFFRRYGLMRESDPDLDLFFGPRVFSLATINLALKEYVVMDEKIIERNEFIDPEEYLNTIYFPIVSALFQKKRVASVTIPFKYPDTQRQNEETKSEDNVEKFKEYRRNQRKGIMLGMLEFVKYLKNKKSIITKKE